MLSAWGHLHLHGTASSTEPTTLSFTQREQKAQPQSLQDVARGACAELTSSEPSYNELMETYFKDALGRIRHCICEACRSLQKPQEVATLSTAHPTVPISQHKEALFSLPD